MLKRCIVPILLVLFNTHAVAAEFTLASPTIEPNSVLSQDHVLNGFGCSGKNISPALTWSNPPAGTKSYAITMYDPDAPTGSGWWHWVVYNVPADSRNLVAGAGDSNGDKLPKGAVQGRTDFGSVGFGGSCPPVGDKPHHYMFTIYALKVELLPVPADATAAMIGFMINSNQIAKATLPAIYSR